MIAIFDAFASFLAKQDTPWQNQGHSCSLMLHSYLHTLVFISGKQNGEFVREKGQEMFGMVLRELEQR